MELHQFSIENIFVEMESSPQGLSDEEVLKRLALHGPNVLAEKQKCSPLLLFISQFGDFMILVLLGAAVLAGIIGDPSDMLPIIAIVLINAAIGFVQEYRAERAIAALKRMAGQRADVLRGGHAQVISAENIVPGDLVLLEAGNVVPADLRLIETFQLRVAESSLTGESFPVEKQSLELSNASIPLAERYNMAYRGTVIASGRGMGIAVATGMATELGKIATMIQGGREPKTPLQKKLSAFGRRLAFGILVVCALVFCLGLLRGEPILLMFLTAISLAVAAIPEALPAVVTISLALGARRMVNRNALIRKLPAVETLGAVSYICTDKTGTLTLNKMKATELYLDGAAIHTDNISNVSAGSLLADILMAVSLCNDVRLNEAGDAMGGDPTDLALYALARSCGIDKRQMSGQYPRVGEIPFDSERKCMTTLHACSAGIVSFTKGAVEKLVEKASGMRSAAGNIPMAKEEFYRINEQMATSGMRVIAVATRQWESMPAIVTPDQIERDYIVIGLVGIMDPPRVEAQLAVSLCKGAGIVPVMITGDHQLTAEAIARRLEILDDDGEKVLTGLELDGLSLAEFERRVENIRVYARVAPEQKLKIVQALQDKGHFVAMTGDGVNDAPALKKADIGVAMGITGSDVAKEAAAMILLDDNFATIVNAVGEGRRIYTNILRFVTYSITSNMGTLIAIVIAPFLGLPLPLIPVQILWLNLLCDSLPGLALAVEPADMNIMRRPPVPPDVSVFAEGRLWYMLRYGLLLGLTAILLQWYALHSGYAWQTMVFTYLVVSRMGVALAVRTHSLSLLQVGLFTNRPLAGAILVTFILQFSVVWIPLLNPVFSTVPLKLTELLLTLVFATLVLFVSEAEKLMLRFRVSHR